MVVLFLVGPLSKRAPAFGIVPGVRGATSPSLGETMTSTLSCFTMRDPRWRLTGENFNVPATIEESDEFYKGSPSLQGRKSP